LYDTNYAQLNYNDTNYVWTDSSGVTLQTYDGANYWSAVFDTTGNLSVPGVANINGTIISQTQILGDGNGIQLVDFTNGSQINWNNNSYVWVDSTGVNFEVANTITANMDNNGDWSLPNNLTVVANISSTSGIFNGDGGGLSNIAGGNVTGTVANATHASTANTVVDAAQSNITSVGTLTSLTVTGNVDSTTGIFNGDGGGLSNIVAGNIVGTVANATHASTANTVVDAAQSNITSVGTLTSLDVSGNLTSGNANLGDLAIANFFSGDGSNLSNVIADQIFVNNANSSSSSTFYPIFTSSTGNAEVELDNFGNTIDYVPATGTLSFKQANVDIVTNGGQETIELDGSNNKINISVTGAANAVVLTDVAMVASIPMQLPVYASNGARDAAILSPSAGMMIFVSGQGMQVSNGSAWNNVAGTA
jgi:hypothetical protein